MNYINTRCCCILNTIQCIVENYIGKFAGINAFFTQDQFNALVGLRYNIGNLGEVQSLLDYLEKGSYVWSQLEKTINSYHDEIIAYDEAVKVTDSPKYKNQIQNKNRWCNRTTKMLNIFFNGNYGDMPIDAVNGREVL